MSTRTSTRTIEKLLAAYRLELGQGASALELYNGLQDFAAIILATESDGDEVDTKLRSDLRALAVALSESMIIAMAHAGLATEIEGHLENGARRRVADWSSAKADAA
ncbi:MAG: hypothetical protein ACKV2T_17140 [Kofleriaceae bacterium]